ncbi:mechanosensitive ion channel [Pseudooceanicola sp. CBS1P-1]|uniref:Mechanosensitive ion channel n=1 Tax=Pseudooceanicola albus TaxID=2692189 RepID=A0A6L7GA70_9RHOB|nr:MULTISPECIES: mechanosensitive ion channel domain-containing protein [Pseudooceanicola]MBT9386355.1 mechanosensitive ion channel [Pseudooceanicola endophyticus]MXN20487.1 mechanosensitive ion channel [Pseudooceanicola albus]
MEELLALWADLLHRATLLAQIMLRPWVGYQLAIAAGLFLACHLAARVLSEPARSWMRNREGWPKWRLRLLLILHRRMRLILFTATVWPLIWIMRQTTWPSRSHILGIVGQLAFTWLAITLATRIIANSALRSLVRIGGWAWATLVILRLDDDAEALLRSFSFTLGQDTVLSAWTLLQAAVILTLLFTLARFLSHASAASIARSHDISPSMQVLTVKALQILLYGMAFFIGLKSVGVDLTGLAVLSGAIGVGLGFGLQKVVSNLVSGVIILLDKSVKPGDVISLGDTFGWIEALGARYVSVVTRDGREYLIPNEDLITGQVVNWSHSNDFVRLDIHFGTSYGDDPHRVRRLAIEAALGVDRVLKDRRPVCHITGFGDSSVDYILRFWITDPTGGLTNIRGNVFLALWDTFHANGVTIPFPQREVRMLADLPPARDNAAD